MRIGIYDPYLDTLGGGEKYILDLASYFSEKNDVFIFWNDTKILNLAEERFNIKLSRVRTARNIFTKGFFIQRFLEARKYDVVFFVSDGSVPFLLSKRNILIFQFPVNWINGKNLLTKIKFKKINSVICYSNFVKEHLDKTFNIKTIVIPPLVKAPFIQGDIKKEKIILTVGRFTKGANTKKQEEMINIFKEMVNKGLKGWKLIIIGARLNRDKDFVEDLKQKTRNFPINILDNVSHADLLNYYDKASIYWHAAGLGEDLEKYPERAEHFGITTVEAMARGAVPVVINFGGQKEIVENKKSGFLWKSKEELIGNTLILIKDSQLMKKMSDAAQERAKFFAGDNFYRRIDSLIE